MLSTGQIAIAIAIPIANEEGFRRIRGGRKRGWERRRWQIQMAAFAPQVGDEDGKADASL